MESKNRKNNISIIPVFENLNQALKKKQSLIYLKEVIKYCGYYKSI